MASKLNTIVIFSPLTAREEKGATDAEVELLKRHHNVVVNPDLTHVRSVKRHYWKRNWRGEIVYMNSLERLERDQALAQYEIEHGPIQALTKEQLLSHIPNSKALRLPSKNSHVHLGKALRFLAFSAFGALWMWLALHFGH